MPKKSQDFISSIRNIDTDGMARSRKRKRRGPQGGRARKRRKGKLSNVNRVYRASVNKNAVRFANDFRVLPYTYRRRLRAVKAYDGSVAAITLLGDAIAASSILQLKLNDCHNPFGAGNTNQPRGWDQLTSYYEQYVVVRSTARITLFPVQGSECLGLMVNHDDDTTHGSATSLNTLQNVATRVEEEGWRVGYSGNSYANKPLHMTISYDARKWKEAEEPKITSKRTLGSIFQRWLTDGPSDATQETESSYGEYCAVTASPSKAAYGLFQLFNYNTPSSQIDYRILVTIDFDVQFARPKPAAASAST